MSLLLLISYLSISNVNAVELTTPMEIELQDNVWYHFSIDYCRWEAIDDQNDKLAINITAHCFCQYDPDTETSYNCAVPGPTLVMYSGTTVLTNWWNRLEGLTEVDETISNEYRDMDIINIHTHGFHVSPDDDNVFIAVPPQTNQTYIYNMPSDHYPGTHWLHTHHHGSASFLISSGLFAAILVKYEDESSFDARLRNMPYSTIIFHYHWVITTDACVPCPGPQNNNGFCSEYCRFPTANKQASSYEYDVESDFNNTEMLFTNGQYRPTKTIEINTFEMLRIISVNPRYWTQWEFSDTTNCEWWLLAKDGVYLDAARDLSADPYYGQYILAAAGRADIAVKCSQVGTYYFNTTQEDVSTRISAWDRVPADNILLYIEVVNTDLGQSTVTALPTTFPDRPTYLTDLQDATEIDSDLCYVELDQRFLNGKSYNSSYYEFEINLGKYTEFEIWSPRHIYHQHINHFQLMDDVANGFAGTAGDWHDVMGGNFNMRMYAADYTGRVMIHCHFLQHEDEGMMSYYLIKDSTNYPCVPTKNRTDSATSSPTTQDPTTANPTSPTTAMPTMPSQSPSEPPSSAPTATRAPTEDPTTSKPSENPTTGEPTTSEPTKSPTRRPRPTAVTSAPSLTPSGYPTSDEPTSSQPTISPLPSTPTTVSPTTKAPAKVIGIGDEGGGTDEGKSSSSGLYAGGGFTALDWAFTIIVLIVMCGAFFFGCCYVKKRRDKKQSGMSTSTRLNSTEMANNKKNGTIHVRPKVTTSFGAAHELPTQDTKTFDAALAGVALTKQTTNVDIKHEEVANQSDEETNALNTTNGVPASQAIAAEKSVDPPATAPTEEVNTTQQDNGQEYYEDDGYEYYEDDEYEYYEEPAAQTTKPKPPPPPR